MNTSSGMTQPPIDGQTQFAISLFKSAYQTFDSRILQDLPKLYAPDVVFKDPIHQFQGLDALTRYFAGFFQPGLECRFEFVAEIITHEQAFLQWQMHYRHPKLKQGQPLTLSGGSLLKFTNHIFYHEDFYDMGAMIYQHVPILGWAIKGLNSRLASAS